MAVFRFGQSPAVIGLDIGSSAIKAIELQRTGRGRRVAAYAMEPVVVLYEWSFGDGGNSSSTSASTNHAYTAAGTYTVTLTVTDDVGQTGTASSDVIVVAGIVANFSISPTNPLTNTSVNFNGGDSTTATGASIVEYAWDFGNGSTLTGTSATAPSTYTAARTYTIRLTIRDSAGRTATVTKTVTVTAPGA